MRLKNQKKGNIIYDQYHISFLTELLFLIHHKFKSMESKWILFIGIILLTLGILLKKFSELSIEPLLLIVVGVLFKIYYIIQKARHGEYKPSYELLFLFVGLLLFATGTYLKTHEPHFNPSFLIIPGILFKITFIILVIVNIKALRKHNNLNTHIKKETFK